MSMITLNEIQEKTTPLFDDADVAFAGVFGSFARGEAKEGSDIDIVVRFRNPKGLLEFFTLQNALEEELGRPVDLATERALDQRLRPHILKELKPIYGER